MSSLSVNFNQFVELCSIQSSTVNTSLLNNLLHIIINQLQLSSNFIELHGFGSAAVENPIVNSQQHCGMEKNEFLMKEEVDETTGNIIRKQPKFHELDSDLTQVHSIVQIENVQTAIEALGKVISLDENFTTPDNSLKTIFDFIKISSIFRNASKLSKSELAN